LSKTLGGVGRPAFLPIGEAPRLSAGGCERGASILLSGRAYVLHADWLLTATWLLLTAGVAMFYFAPFSRLIGV
jgi:hypothetical protein